MHPDPSSFISTFSVDDHHIAARLEHLFDVIRRVALGVKNAVVLARHNNLATAARIDPGHDDLRNAGPGHGIRYGAEHRDDRSAGHWPVGEQVDVVVPDAGSLQRIFKRFLTMLKQCDSEYIHDNHSNKRKWMARQVGDRSSAEQRCLAAIDFRQGYSRFRRAKSAS